MSLLVLLFVFGLVSYFKPTVAVGLILAFLPTYLIRLSYGGIPTTFLELLLLIFLAVTFFANIRRLHLLKHEGYIDLFTGLFVIAGIVATVTSPDKHAAIGILKAFVIEPVLLFYALKLVIQKDSDLKTPLNMLFLSAVTISVLGIGQYFTFIHLPLRFWGTGAEVERIVSVFEYPNALALYLAPLASFFLASLLFGKQMDRKNLSVGLLIIFVALFLTFSRGAWLATAATALVLLAYRYDWKKVAGAGILLGLLLLAIPASRNRLDLISKDSSSSARLDLMSAALIKIEQNPFLGNGLGGFRATLAQQNFRDEILNYPHNIFLNFWIEMGILGLVSFFGIMFVSANRTKKHLQWYSIAAIGFLLTMVIHGLVDVPYFKNDLSVLFWFVISIFYVSN